VSPHANQHDAAAPGWRTKPLADFVTALVGREDPVLREIRLDTPRRGLPPISVGPDEGRLLHFLTRACGARKAVEVGTLAGYSACWIAKALPADGVLRTVEADPRHAAVARENIAKAGLSGKVFVHEGLGTEVLPTLRAHGPFDLVFIDADKEGYPDYARWAADALRPGGLVVCDNAYLFGKLHRDDLPADDADAAKVPAMRRLLAFLADESLFSSCAMIPTGEGMAVAVRR
jgi:caffeoyl-CoA O-methyltransferase